MQAANSSRERKPLGAALATLLLILATSALAATALPPPPLDPLPEPEPAPPEIASDAELQAEIKVYHRDQEMIEEHRVSGRLTWIKVTPQHGRPYFLVADGPNGGFVRRDSVDTGLRVPMWLLFSF
ncbi:MAG: DUF2782 domain-containing protein [Casimicrobiaceae bacterium]